MGTIQEEYLIVQGYSDFEKEVLENVDKWISNLEEEWRKLFVKCETHSNGCVTYFMNWDGSKEGWESSERGNELREEFIKICLENGNPRILHIKPSGEIFEEDSIERREEADESLIRENEILDVIKEKVENATPEELQESLDFINSKIKNDALSKEVAP